VHAAIQSAHDAYRHADELARDRTAVRVDFGRRGATWEDVGRWTSEEISVPTRHLVAGAGGVLAFVIGAAVGFWLQIPG
jgi:hypothetical protein